MNALKKRLPPRQDITLVFTGITFIVHVWAIINMFYIVPAWVLRMHMGQLVGSMAYILVFALFESLLILASLILAAVLLPEALLRQNFLAKAASAVLVTALFSIVVHFNYEFLVINRAYLLALALAYLPCLALCLYLAGRFRNIDLGLRTILDRLSPLTSLYIFIDVIGLIVIIVRNL